MKWWELAFALVVLIGGQLCSLARRRVFGR